MNKNVKLNNGYEIPAIGLGTYDCAYLKTIMKQGIDIGFRLFDTAYVYRNEYEIGRAIKEKRSDKTIKRKDLFVVTKLWNTKHKPEKVIPSLRRSLSELHLEYVDLFLIHTPTAYRKLNHHKLEIFNLIEEDTSVTLEQTWRAMEKAVRRGFSKSIGLSNFNSQQIDRILKIAKIKPVVNQIEVHPYLNQRKLIQFCKERDIVVMAYSALFAPHPRQSHHPDARLLEEPILKEIAKKHNKTPAQVSLRYLTQLGTVPIPKTSYSPHVEENFDIFEFTLTDEDIRKVDSLNRGLRCTPINETRNFKEYPFDIEY